MCYYNCHCLSSHIKYITLQKQKPEVKPSNAASLVNQTTLFGCGAY